MKSDGKTPYERLRGRPYGGQVAEFAEVVHFGDPQKAVDVPKFDDRWSLGLWLGKELGVGGVHRPESAGVGPSGGVQRISAGVKRGMYITLDRQIKHGGTKGMSSMFRACESAFTRMPSTISGYRGQ